MQLHPEVVTEVPPMAWCPVSLLYDSGWLLVCLNVCAWCLGETHADLVSPKPRRVWHRAPSLPAALSPQTTQVASAASTACRPTGWTRAPWASTTRARPRSTSRREVSLVHAAPALTHGCPLPSRHSFTHKHLGISPVVQIGLLSTYT